MRKILIICNDLELGGIQKSLIEFLNYLVKTKAFEVDLMLWQKEGPLEKMLPKEVQLIFQEYPTTRAQVFHAKSALNKISLLLLFLKAQYFSRILNRPWLFYSKTAQHYDIAISFTHNGLPRFFTIDNVSADYKFLWYHHGSYQKKKKKII